MTRTGMRAGIAVLFAALTAVPALGQQPDAPLPSCSDAANCPLIDFTRRTLGTGLDGVVLTPSGTPGLLLARTNDGALQNFRLIWLDQVPPMAPDRAATEFMRGLNRPGRFCNQRPVRGPATLPADTAAFDLRCAAGNLPEIQVWFLAVQTPTRTRAVAFLAPLESGPALLALGNRILGAYPSAVVAARPQIPANYDQLRRDCADDSDAQRQIAGCNAVLAHPGETNNYAIAINNRGHALERSGNAAAALQDYDRALQREPDYVVAHINRGRVLTGMGRLDEALAALDRSIVIDDNSWARVDRARLFVRRGEIDRALVDLGAVLQRDAAFAEALVERGKILAGRGDHQAALKDFEAALAAEPGNAQAREGRDKARASAAPPPAGEGTRIDTVRGLRPEKPFTLSFPSELQRSAGGDAELALNHPSAILQVALKVAPASAGANARDAARAPAATVAAQDRKTFADFALEHRSLMTLPAGPAHVYMASMTSDIGDRPRLRLIVAELFSEGRRYELSFMVGEDILDSARNLIGFVMSNLATSAAPRTCCADPAPLPW